MNPIMAPHSVEAAGLDDLADEVQARVAKQVQQLPLLGPYSMDTSSDYKEELPLTTQCRKPLKSDRLRIADTQVLRKVDLPHEFVYLADGKPAD